MRVETGEHNTNEIPLGGETQYGQPLRTQTTGLKPCKGDGKPCYYHHNTQRTNGPQTTDISCSKVAGKLFW